jgi:eukaryotic-like serine/threonine-protein kinase
MSPAAGTVLSERYTLTGRIAAGGMGEVWAASDTVLGRNVAVKLLDPALSQQPGFLDRFRAEARYSAALHHPNITTVFDYGEDDGSAYLVMELVAGQPLSQMIAEQAPLSARTTASILIQAATALEAAHQGGVIHRDVKPANILVTPDGTAKLTDFGISRLVETSPLTQTGQVIGTAQYLAPELVTGQSASASSDIYALGVVGHEMLTGRRPFDGDTVMATAFAQVNQPPPPLPDTVPVGLRNVIDAALSKEPGDRPASAAAMAAALGAPDTSFTSGSLAPAAVTDRTQAIPALGGVSALGGEAPGVSPQVLSPPTQVMSTQSLSGEPPGIPDQRSRLRPAWILGLAAAGTIGVLAAFALPGGSDKVPTPTTTTTTAPTSEQSIAPESPSTTTEIAPPVESSPTPGPHDRARGRARSHDNKKDGKQ